MKKMLFIMCLIIAISGCVKLPNGEREIKDSDNSIVYTTKIGDCEYLKFRTYNGRWGYTHKGDCNNPIHIYKEGVELNRVD